MIMIKKLYPFRFELFLSTQILILFGSLIVPTALFDSVISPLLFLVNLITGIVFVSKDKIIFKTLIVILVLNSLIFFFNISTNTFFYEMNVVRLFCFFVFYAIVTLEVIMQVARISVVRRKAIFGLMSGYISLGLLAFFMFLMIEYMAPNSFANLQSDANNLLDLDKLLYFSYVTLLTIGYGEIYPLSSLAQKGAVLIALLGQFYLVILTAIVVGKYLNQKN